MRFVNALVFALAVAILFMCVGMPERAAIKAQDDKPAAVEPAKPVEPVIAEVATVTADDLEALTVVVSKKIADLQSQVNELRAKMGELQCKCDAPKAAAPQPPVPQAAAPAAPKAGQCYIDPLTGRQVCPLLKQRAQAQAIPPVQAGLEGIVLNPGEVLVEVGGVPVANQPKRTPVLFPNVSRRLR